MSKALNIIEAMKMPIGTEFMVMGSKRYESTAEILKSDDYSCTKFLVWNGNPAYPVNICDATMFAKFIPIQKPVSFMEAIKASKEGKVIKVYIEESEYTYYPTNRFLGLTESKTQSGLSTREILDGKWYIEESEEIKSE